MSELSIYQVWFAGDHAEVGAVVFATAHAEAAAIGARHLFEPHDPLDTFDVFVCRQGFGMKGAQRFTILADVNRARYDETTGTMTPESVEFTPKRVVIHDDHENTAGISVGTQTAGVQHHDQDFLPPAA